MCALNNGMQTCLGACDSQLHPRTFSLVVRTSSLSTFDSIELGRYSDDGNKETDDRVAGTREGPKVTHPSPLARNPL